MNRAEIQKEDEEKKKDSVSVDQILPVAVDEGDRVLPSKETTVSEVQQDEASDPRPQDAVPSATRETSSVPALPELQNGKSLDGTFPLLSSGQFGRSIMKLDILIEV
jgi:hypothetical protein